MKKRTISTLLMAAMAFLSFHACMPDWDQQDPPAGNQVYPKLEKKGEFTFNNEEGVNPLDPTTIMLFGHNGGDVPVLENADDRSSQYLNLNSGYARLKNPINNKKQEAVSVVFYVKSSVDKPETELLSWQTADGKQRASINANGTLRYKAIDGELTVNDESKTLTGMLDVKDEWRKVALCVHKDGYFVYVDGLKRIDETVTNFNMQKVVDFMANVPYVYAGYCDEEAYVAENYMYDIDDITFYLNRITEKEWKGTGKSQGGGEETTEFFAPVYFQSFDGGAPDCEIIGGGQFIFADQVHGMVFKNKTGEIRTNYLKLPSDLFSKVKANEEVTISFWVNKGSEEVSFWSPLFSAYGSAPNPNNGMPMLVCQTRGVLQVNNAGWSDYTDAQNVEGTNTLTTAWLDDAKWHLYCATFTPTKAAVYVDGEVINAWEIDGTANTAAGIFTDGDALNYICLGGNQAWDWGDVDQGFMFDDFALYDRCISKDQMKAIMASKSPSYMNTFENKGGDAQIFGGGAFENINSAWGTVFKNAVGGMRTNYCMIPSHVFADAAGNQAITVGFWVNKGDQSVDVPWYPLFSAYGAQNTIENGMPMFMCQSRLLLQINNNGWSDYTNEQNVNGQNTEQIDWIKDGQWHYYTLTLTPTTACIYIDGEVMNQWEIDGTTNTAAGFFSNAADYQVICLGGNQAWNWGDPDPGFWFDDFVVFDRVCTQSEIKNILMAKKASK